MSAEPRTPGPRVPGMRFVANLRGRTIEAFGRHDIQPDAYLLSTHRLSPAALDHAHAQRDRGIPLIADNGTKEMIDQVIATFREPARTLWHRVRDIRNAIGRIPRGQDVPEDLRENAGTLAHAVVDAALELSDDIDHDELLEAQLSMRPTHLVAKEDFAVACLLALNLERETTGWRVDAITRRNRRSIGLWRRVRQDPRVSDGHIVFAVLSGTDYNTARAAGRLAADAGVDDVAVGCAGFMLDRTAVDFFTIGTANFALERPVPRRYARFTQVMAGIRDGFRDGGRPLKSLHALGLGAPPMFPVFVATTPPEASLTTDATSPIQDAVRDRVLYDPVGHGDRLSLPTIVRDILEGQEWPFSCPFCRQYRAERGHDPEAARRAWASAGGPEVDSAFLSTSETLAAALPLFVDPERLARPTHVAHNHWVVGALCREVGVGEDRVEWAIERIRSLKENVYVTTGRGLRASIGILDAIADRP